MQPAVPAKIEALRREYESGVLQVVPRDAEARVMEECQLLLARYFEAADKEARKRSHQPDSSGWVTVSYRKGSAPHTAAPEAEAKGAAKATAKVKAKKVPGEAVADADTEAARALVFGRGQSRARRQLERQRRREKEAAELHRVLETTKAGRLEAKQDRLGELRRSFADKLRTIQEQRKFRPDA